MNLELRKFHPSEYERMAQIRNSIFSDNPMSSQELRAFDESFDPKYYRQRYSCFNLTTEDLVAFGSIGHMAWSFHPQRFAGGIMVDETSQNKGVGRFVYEKLLSFLAELRATELLATVKEGMPVAASFVEKRGFKELERTSQSTLDPAKVNVSNLPPYFEKASGAGIEISSLSRELELDLNCYRKL